MIKKLNFIMTQRQIYENLSRKIQREHEYPSEL